MCGLILGHITDVINMELCSRLFSEVHTQTWCACACAKLLIAISLQFVDAQDNIVVMTMNQSPDICKQFLEQLLMFFNRDGLCVHMARPSIAH
jgi:hypothetical protein